MAFLVSVTSSILPDKWDKKLFRVVPQGKTTITKVAIERALTGEISSHSHAGGAGSGDMETTTYDPTSVEGDAFDMDNMAEGTTNKILTADERSLIASALQSETSHADVLVDGDVGVTVAAVSHNHDGTYAPALTIVILTKSSSVNQNVGGANNTEVWWTWDGEDRKDTGFTHSTSTNSERIQVDADGWYQIRFVGNVMQTGGSRTTLQGIIRVNGGATQRKGTIRDYTRGSAYGNLSPGLDCIMQLSDGDYIEVGTKVEDTDGTYTLSTNGAEIADDENILYITKIG